MNLDIKKQTKTTADEFDNLDDCLINIFNDKSVEITKEDLKSQQEESDCESCKI